MNSSDEERRSLKKSLSSRKLSDEARRFLKPEREEEPVTPPDPTPSERPELFGNDANPQSSNSHRTTMTMKAAPHFSVVIPAIVSMTSRLPAPLAARLVGVATERKLQREKPFTQQDIVSEALRQWFVRNGY